MNNKKIFSLLVMSLLITTNASAMFDGNEKTKMVKDNVEVQVMGGAEIMETKMEEKKEMVRDMEEKDENKMKDMEENMYSDNKITVTKKNRDKVIKEGEEILRKEKNKMNEIEENSVNLIKKAKGIIDVNIKKIDKKIEDKSNDEKIKYYLILNDNIDNIINKYSNMDISDIKKNAYVTLFEYIKKINNIKLINLQIKEITK